MNLGVERGTVRLTMNSIGLTAKYEKERVILVDIFGNNFIDIQHIGSTSIPNINVKPIIDIAIKVESIDNLEKIQKKLEQVGYEERMGRLKGRQKVFAKGGDKNITHHLHIIEKGLKDWDEKIRFKNILLNDKSIARQYSELKIKLAAKYGDDRANYTKEKSIFIKKILEHI